MNELDLMGRLQHPNIVRLLEYFLQDDPSLPHCGACIIVMDLLEGADLMDYIDEAAGFSRDDVTVRVRCLLHTVRARRRERERERLCVCVWHAMLTLHHAMLTTTPKQRTVHHPGSAALLHACLLNTPQCVEVHRATPLCKSPTSSCWHRTALVHTGASWASSCLNQSRLTQHTAARSRPPVLCDTPPPPPRPRFPCLPTQRAQHVHGQPIAQDRWRIPRR